jgi:prephenate dehydrogenase
MHMVPNVHIIGCGLIGTSIALSLRKSGYKVSAEDINADHVAQARYLGALATLSVPQFGETSGQRAEVVFICVPPGVAAETINVAFGKFDGALILDVSSVRRSIIDELDRELTDSGRVMGAHPMAGREVSGPNSARADLFQDRIWVLTQGSEASRVTAAMVITDMGGALVTMEPADHDRAVALVSHVPQLVSSALAAQLIDAAHSDLAISGSGLGDTIRIAGSDPNLWSDILQGNATEISRVLRQVSNELAELSTALEAKDRVRIEQTLRAGNEGKARIPGKHGSGSNRFESVNVMISDQPGALAELFAGVGVLDINLEDVRIEHVMGRPSGIVQLFVPTGKSEELESGLYQRGFDTRGRQ